MVVSASCLQEEARGEGCVPKQFPEAFAQEYSLSANPALAGEALISARVVTRR